MFPSIFLWNIQIDTIGVPIYSMGCAEIRYIMNPILKLYFWYYKQLSAAWYIA